VANTIINVSFYSINPLPMEIRRTFELPVWPYSDQNAEMPKELVDYFFPYSIFYYRDEITKENQLRPGLINPKVVFETPIDCYAHSCYIDYGMRTFRVVPWWGACSREFVQQCLKQTGDKMAWTTFNEHRTLKGFNSRFIKAPLVSKTKVVRPIKSVEDFR
jgi:hypothetical protein